jgi:hypothetical protein
MYCVKCKWFEPHEIDGGYCIQKSMKDEVTGEKLSAFTARYEIYLGVYIPGKFCGGRLFEAK